MNCRKDILKLVAGQLFDGELSKWVEVDKMEEDHEKRNQKTF